jgi:hypothetical protein
LPDALFPADPGIEKDEKLTYKEFNGAKKKSAIKFF